MRGAIRAPAWNAAPVSSPLVGAVRSVGVVFAPPLALGALAAGAAASCVRSLARGRRPPGPALAGTALTALYVLRGRSWMRSWGATDAETRAPLPGDDVVPHPLMQSTMAVTIAAPPAEVWPWLAQMGQDRGGFYSYAWLENLAGCRMVNADTVHPEWQHREIGETVYLHPLTGMPVERFEPESLIALRGWGTFVLQPLAGGRARLLIRTRTPGTIAAVASMLLVEIPHWVMQRRMLLGIRERAERR